MDFTEKHRRVYFPISHIGLEMTAESLKLLLQLPHQRDAVVGNLPDVLSDLCGRWFLHEQGDREEKLYRSVIIPMWPAVG